MINPTSILECVLANKEEPVSSITLAFNKKNNKLIFLRLLGLKK